MCSILGFYHFSITSLFVMIFCLPRFPHYWYFLSFYDSVSWKRFVRGHPFSNIVRLKITFFCIHTWWVICLHINSRLIFFWIEKAMIDFLLAPSNKNFKITLIPNYPLCKLLSPISGNLYHHLFVPSIVKFCCYVYECVYFHHMCEETL